MILAQQLNLQHEHSLNHKNLLPGNNPPITLGPCALHSQSSSLLLCLSNPFFPVSPQEVIKQIAAFMTFFLTMWAVVCHKRIYNLRSSSDKLPHTGKEINIAFTCRQVTPLPATTSAKSLSQILESVTFKSAGPALQVMKTFLLWPPHWQDIYPTQAQIQMTCLLKK